MNKYLLVASALLLLSCTPKNRLEDLSSPPATSILNISLRYAVVQNAYVQVFDVAADRAIVLGQYRKGTIIPINERISLGPDKNWEVWLNNEGPVPGWVRAIDCQVFDSEAQARTAAKALMQ